MYYVGCALIKLARDIVLLLYVVVRDCLSLLICHDPEHLSLLHGDRSGICYSFVFESQFSKFSRVNDDHMASYQVSAPEPFNFSRPTEWVKWIRRFERFRVASGIDKHSEAAQVNSLVYSMTRQTTFYVHSIFPKKIRRNTQLSKRNLTVILLNARTSFSNVQSLTCESKRMAKLSIVLSQHFTS